MSIARNRNILKRRIDDYIWRNRSSNLIKLRMELFPHFLNFDRAAIVGGFVRDFARSGQTAFKSDIDIVVDARTSDVHNLALKLNATPNRFGGYSYAHPNWKIDFWALENTWAHKNGLAKIDALEDVITATFFDWDSAIYDLKSRKIHVAEDYITKLESNVLDINLIETPSIEGNLLRAVRRVLIWNLSMGSTLSTFIEKNLNNQSFENMKLVESKIYSQKVVSNFKSPSEILHFIHSIDDRRALSTDHGKQLRLPGI